MAIQFVSIKCPECEAALDIEEGRQYFFCSYCGTKVMVQNENEYTYRHIDEASIKQAETDRMVRMRQLDMEEHISTQGSGLKKILTSIWIVLSLIIITICIVNIAILNDYDTGFLLLFFLGFPVVGAGGYLIFKLLPEKESERVLLNNGGIRLPKNIFPYSEQNYEALQSTLRSLGYRNITCVNMHDLTLGLLRKPGKVESISINGEKVSSGGKVYMPDVAITITYHGK